MKLLTVRNLSIAFPTKNGWFQAVEGINLDVTTDEVLAIVGESGSGKSVAMLALMNLLPPQARITCDELVLDTRNLLDMNIDERRSLNGGTVAMIFQEPMSSLNPCFTVGYQIDEAVRIHLGGSAKERKERVLHLLESVGIPDPKQRYKAYPHQLSGGMSQRVMIAMALAGKPKLLIADEPTTALDVTVQAQILELLLKLQEQYKMGLIMITHDMGIVAETANQVIVQYAGQQVEQQATYELFNRSRHPYTAALLSALPERAPPSGLLPTISGLVPGQNDRPKGCLFAPRCSQRQARCETEVPAFEPLGEGWIRCFYPLELDYE